jgi:hypothetical protein
MGHDCTVEISSFGACCHVQASISFEHGNQQGDDMASAYFAPLVNLPVIINGPGRYITRGGELVKVEVASWRNDFGCTGSYLNMVPEKWHRSGRIFAGMESKNDIVRAL